MNLDRPMSMTNSQALRRIALLLVLAGACGRTPLDEIVPAGKPGTGGASGGKAGSSGGAGQPGSGGTGGQVASGGSGGTGGAGSGGTGGAPKPDADPPLRDAGTDAAPDAQMEPIGVRCPAGGIIARPRSRVTLQGMVSGPIRFGASWRVIVAPPGSAVDRGPVEGTRIDLVPDLVGDYLLRFEASAGRGVDSCTVNIQARALNPMVFCPKESRGTTDRDLVLTGDGKDDDGPVKLSWSVSPPLATLTPTEGPTTRFRAGRAGTYVVTLTATDIDGAQASCSTTVLVLAAPMAMCPPSGEMYARRRDATFEARLDNPRGLTTTWTLLKRPAGSRAELNPRDQLFTDINPDVVGEYVLEFVARSLDGLESRCQTSFLAVTEAPTLDCSDVDTRPLTDTDITAGLNDNGDIARWEWALVSQPPGSAVRPMFPAGDAFTFRPDLAGDYGFTLSVTDDEGLSAACKFVVHAAAEEGLRVEMFWDTPDTDMDLHLLSPLARRWFDETTHQDCFYSNCTGTPPNWSNQSTELDDPHLDLDDTDGLGPENINVDRPGPGIYRVGVHNFSGLVKTNVTVRLYCGGSRLEPRVTLGPVTLTEEQVWKAADVETFADGRCDVKKIVNPDGSPVVVSRAAAELAR
jgi:hypothetical protein